MVNASDRIPDRGLPGRIGAVLPLGPGSGGRHWLVADHPWYPAVVELTGRAIVAGGAVVLVSHAGSAVVATVLAGLFAMVATGLTWNRRTASGRAGPG